MLIFTCISAMVEDPIVNVTIWYLNILHKYARLIFLIIANIASVYFVKYFLDYRALFHKYVVSISTISIDHLYVWRFVSYLIIYKSRRNILHPYGFKLFSMAPLKPAMSDIPLVFTGVLMEL